MSAATNDGDGMTDEELKAKRQAHLDALKSRTQKTKLSDCAHNRCSQCWGTFIKADGSPCVHFMSCACPMCNRVRL